MISTTKHDLIHTPPNLPLAKTIASPATTTAEPSAIARLLKWVVKSGHNTISLRHHGQRTT